jgi:maltooligosyltrehalose trehalohydrolase
LSAQCTEHSAQAAALPASASCALSTVQCALHLIQNWPGDSAQAVARISHLCTEHRALCAASHQARLAHVSEPVKQARRRSVGAELVDGGVHFRVWAPAHRQVAVVIGGREHTLDAEAGGYFSGLVGEARAGTRYRFRLGDDASAWPDPASRFQPDGPHGESEVIDPGAFEWRANGWRGVEPRGVVLTEIHFGTFTADGTFAAAIEKLPLIADAGINLIEVMPVNEFPGRFGWGYDGVDLWAPTRLYGTPDDFRRFVDAAHSHNLGVILDVVYNHFGPDGCYMSKFTPSYFTKRYKNEWGEAINFDGDDAAGVREFFSENAAYWIDEFRLDGLRLDATQTIHDASKDNIVAVCARRARAAAGDRTIFVVAENEPQDVALINQLGLDAMWNDDWHHAALVALTGKSEAYYTDYHGSAQEFVSMAKLGFLYQGQRYKWQKQRRGTPSHELDPRHLVLYIENHDQIANSASGKRVVSLTSPGRFRAMTALMLLLPQTPMLFQGEEFGSTTPFLYFADQKPELAEMVSKGRRDFLSQFPSISAIAEHLAAPHELSTFEQCKLDWSERDRNAGTLALHRDLLALRRSDAVFSAQRKDILHGAVLNEHAFVLRWLAGGDDDRLLVANFGRALHLDPAPEPLLAPPAGATWEILWSSESPQYGGSGTAPLDGEENWRIPAEAAVVLKPRRTAALPR